MAHLSQLITLTYMYMYMYNNIIGETNQCLLRQH